MVVEFLQGPPLLMGPPFRKKELRNPVWVYRMEIKVPSARGPLEYSKDDVEHPWFL